MSLENLKFQNLLKLESPIKESLKLSLYFKDLTISYKFQNFMFLTGSMALFYYVSSFSKFILTSFLQYIKSQFNSQQYLDPYYQEEDQVEKQRYYAIIYGSSTKPGGSFAHFLAEKGYNLILIDRNPEPQNDIQLAIKNKGLEDIQIVKIVLNNFQEDQVIQNLSIVKDLKVKIFINCKNAKVKPIQQKNNFNSQQEENQLMIQQNIISREEIFFLGKENIEGFACLINYFLKNMQYSQNDNPCIINIDNEEEFNENQIQQGQIYFQSTLKFKDTFTYLLGKKLKNFKTINVKVDFKSLQGNQKKSQQLCKQTFAYMGIKDMISI